MAVELFKSNLYMAQCNLLSRKGKTKSNAAKPFKARSNQSLEKYIDGKLFVFNVGRSERTAILHNFQMKLIKISWNSMENRDFSWDSSHFCSLLFSHLIAHFHQI